MLKKAYKRYLPPREEEEVGSDLVAVAVSVTVEEFDLHQHAVYFLGEPSSCKVKTNVLQEHASQLATKFKTNISKLETLSYRPLKLRTVSADVREAAAVPAAGAEIADSEPCLS